MLQLYNYYRSSASFRVRIALNLKNIDYRDIPIHLVNNGGEQFSPDYQKLNPQNLVPTLQDDDKVITQSLSIIEYIDELYPAPPLLPQDPYQKALARSFALVIATDIHPLNNLRVLQYITKTLHISEEQKNQWYHHWIALGFKALEQQLASNNSAGPYCFGSEPCMADIFLIPQIYNAKRYSFDLTPYPNLRKVDEHCQKNPAFIKAWPEEQS